ncbi:MarR family winged helix-turn-helix transcriptional regulator [Micromonospora arida]|uniref:MarR family winged helix-turn-helix transcriptional regulator n=1 Tax=Micromonospora arida TaxID=2203715 RepID=UPI0036BB2B4D
MRTAGQPQARFELRLVAGHGAAPLARARRGAAEGPAARQWGYHILAVVVHEEVPTQGALAARLAIDRSVLTYVIDDLANAGLIERRPDPQDRRARRVVATERGRQTLAEAERRVAHAEDHVLGGLPEEQRRVFRDLAARAAEAIHAAAPATDPCVAVQSVLPPADQAS